MADVVKETHYHDTAEAPAGSGGIVTAVVVIVLVLLAIFLVSRGFGRGDTNNSPDTGTSNPGVQVEGSATGSGSYTP